MTDYKLVPVEPTPEMVGAAEDAYMPFGDMELAVRMAVLVAPAVQWEPVGEVRLELGAQPYVFAELYSESPSVLAPGTKLYAAPQPAEQQPEVLAKGYFHPLPDESDYEFHDAEQFPDGNNCPACVPAVIVRKSAVENQPAPDVAGLVEALSIARDYVFSSLEEKKLALAGYPHMWRCEQDDLAMIDATLSAYRKETSHDK